MEQLGKLGIDPLDGHPDQLLLSAWKFTVSLFTAHAIGTNSISSLSRQLPRQAIPVLILFGYLVPTTNFL
jgi:hypothetical protein